MKDYIPYTYLLKCPNGKFYYGVKYANNGRDVANPSTFFVDYFTSCVHIKNMVYENDTNGFSFEIRKTFSCASDAITWESKVNRRLTTRSDKFINNSYLDGRDQRGSNNGMYGKRHREESKSLAVSVRRNNGTYNPDVMKNSLTAMWSETARKKKSDTIEKKRKHRTDMHIHESKKFDFNHAYSLFVDFSFPHGWDKGKGAKPTKISFFSHWYVDNFPDEVSSSKSPYAMVRSSLIRYCEMINDSKKHRL